MTANIKPIHAANKSIEKGIYLFNTLPEYTNPLSSFINYLKQQKITGRTIYTSSDPESGPHLNLSVRENYLLGPSFTETLSASVHGNDTFKRKNQALNELVQLTLQNSGPVKDLPTEVKALVSIVRSLLLNFPYVFMCTPEKYLAPRVISTLKRAMTYESEYNERKLFIYTHEQVHWLDTAQFFITKHDNKSYQLTTNRLRTKDIQTETLTNRFPIKKSAA